jgi:hypothetical protein
MEIDLTTKEGDFLDKVRIDMIKKYEKYFSRGDVIKKWIKEAMKNG